MDPRRGWLGVVSATARELWHHQSLQDNGRCLGHQAWAEESVWGFNPGSLLYLHSQIEERDTGPGKVSVFP